MTETQTPVAIENPLLEGMLRRRAAEPSIITIFGASGDLTQRKLFPALYALAVRHLLPDRFGVVGVARSDWSTDEFLERMKEAVKEHGRDEFKEDVWNELAGGVRYQGMDPTDEAGWDDLIDTLNELDKERGTGGNRLYYLAVPPKAFEPIVRGVGKRRSTEG